ncbi:immune inhibitor A domain-containing protein [Micromonospora sp. BRA006-A]|nr:immune inhibitor A domain-containing protein [Micromonospora sp. BRA006-A]
MAATSASTRSGRTPRPWPVAATIPGTNLKVSNYIVQPEDAGVGVFAHEFGHDLGLPDLYDTSGNADRRGLLGSDGVRLAPRRDLQALPTHMGLWDKGARLGRAEDVRAG